MAKGKNKHRSKRLPLSLIEPAHKRLEELVETGGYGNTPTEAAKIIIMAHLQALDDKNKINLFDTAPDDNKAS